MKLKNIKTNEEYIILAFITLNEKKDLKLLDIRELKDYILENENNNTRN